MVDLAQRVATRWVKAASYADQERKAKRLHIWAKKLSEKIELSAHQVEGLDPDDWDRSYGGIAMWPAGVSGYGEVPIGYEFELEVLGHVRAEVHIRVEFEDNGSKRYRVKTRVQGKSLPSVEKTVRRLKVPDFFKPLQSYLKSHKDELITPETMVWHSTDPSGNRFFGLTKNDVEWREGYADYFSSLENLQLDLPYELEEWEKKAEALKAEREAEENAAWAADREPDYGALNRKYGPKFEALDSGFKAALKKWLDSEWYAERDKLKNLVKSPGSVGHLISDLKAKGSAGL